MRPEFLNGVLDTLLVIITHTDILEYIRCVSVILKWLLSDDFTFIFSQVLAEKILALIA